MGCLLGLVCISCANNDSLEQALSLAGENRQELEQVLEHYKDEPLRLKAAQFLIENMPGCYSLDSVGLSVSSPLYEAYDLIGKKYNDETTDGWGKAIDSLWQNWGRKQYKTPSVRRRNDVETLTASQLITEIELAFGAWRENVYTRNCSFEDFCEYILPYRRKNGSVVDDARQEFHARHHGRFFVQPGRDLIDEADSLLYQYKNLTHSRFYGVGIPILSASVFEKMGHGLCEQRCWFNTLLFSSFGMAVAIDFVPDWGNRNNSHTWNVLLAGGKSYAFEAFWDEDRWKYKRIYNNKSFDEPWGRFRLPKVYRRTFGKHPEAILLDREMNLEDIPELFKDIRKVDVSHEYFETVDVEVELKKIPAHERYAYLCVFNYNEWKPVQWARIEKGKALFKGMGKDIVYLPGYCKGGQIVPAGEPFLLEQTGNKRVLRAQGAKDTLVVKQFVGAAFHSGNVWHNRTIVNTALLGSETADFSKADTLCVLPQEVEMYSKKIASRIEHPIRYVRLLLPYGKIAFSDLAFYRKRGQPEERLPHARFVQPLDTTTNGERAEYVFDKYLSTGYCKEITASYADIDLGGLYEVSEIRFCPYQKVGFNINVPYELFYWENGWTSLGSKTGEGKHLFFEQVPANALLMIRPAVHMRTQSFRPFIYDNNEVYCY